MIDEVHINTRDCQPMTKQAAAALGEMVRQIIRHANENEQAPKELNNGN